MELKRNERSKDVKGYEGIYAVTTLGRVWSYRRGIWLKQYDNSHGYMFVVLSVQGKDVDKKVHRLVAEAFIANPLCKPQVNHKNGSKSDCRACNLEWVTARENVQHASDMGLNKSFKLSYREKELICKNHWELGVKQAVLAKIFNVSPSAINYIIRVYTPIVGQA